MKKLFAMTVAVLLLFSVLLGIPAAYGQAPETGKTLDILFSHDTHSHLNTFTTVVEDEETDIGGFARANTLIKAQRAKDPDTLVIDGGDFSMGTLIQTVFETQAAELRMLGYMGYDVTTFGNHEFDEGTAELLRMQKGGCHPKDGCYFPKKKYKGADFKWLAANVVDSASGKTLFPATYVKKFGGVSVGFIGLTLKATPAVVTSTGVAGLSGALESGGSVHIYRLLCCSLLRGEVPRYEAA